MICLTGADGQLGRLIQKHLALQGHEFTALTKNDLDISSPIAVKDFLLATKPTLIINTAAYTAVDKAESEFKKAYLVNQEGIENIAKFSRPFNIPIIHFSTDYVFDGNSRLAYLPSDKTYPQSIYGKSKLAGEHFLASHSDHYMVIRTSWVFSEYGHNFLKSMLNLSMAQETLRVVSDQFGTPTYAGHLARVIASIAPRIIGNNFSNGIYHFGGDEVCSWYDFAVEICDAAFRKKIIYRVPEIIPISSAEFITTAKRPKYSAMNSSKICNEFNVTESNWRMGISEALEKIRLSPQSF